MIGLLPRGTSLAEMPDMLRWSCLISVLLACQGTQPVDSACVDFGFACDCGQGLVVGSDQHETTVCSVAFIGSDVNAFCCDDGGTCTCSSAQCEVVATGPGYDCECRVGQALEEGPAIAACDPPPGTVCCMGPYDCACFGDSRFGTEIQVPSCDVARITQCGSLGVLADSCTD